MNTCSSVRQSKCDLVPAVDLERFWHSLWHNQICNHSYICVLRVYWFILCLSRSKFQNFPACKSKTESRTLYIGWHTSITQDYIRAMRDIHVSRAILNSRKEVGNERIEKKTLQNTPEQNKKIYRKLSGSIVLLWAFPVLCCSSGQSKETIYRRRALERPCGCGWKKKIVWRPAMRLYFFPQSIEIPGTVQHISQQPNVRLHFLLFFLNSFPTRSHV